MKLNPRGEKFVALLLVTGIVAPIRLASVSVFGENIGVSLLLVSSIFGTIIYLSKKKNLGWFGEIIERQFLNFHKGRKKFIVIGLSIALIAMSITMISLVHEGDKYPSIKSQVYDELGIEKLSLIHI